MKKLEEVLAGTLSLDSAIKVSGNTEKKDRARFVKVLRDIFNIQLDGPRNVESLVSIGRNHLNAGRGDVIAEFMAFVLKKTQEGSNLQQSFSKKVFSRLFSLIQKAGDRQD